MDYGMAVDGLLAADGVLAKKLWSVGGRGVGEL
jgi:hypothetical protein